MLSNRAVLEIISATPDLRGRSRVSQLHLGTPGRGNWPFHSSQSLPLSHRNIGNTTWCRGKRDEHRMDRVTGDVDGAARIVGDVHLLTLPSDCSVPILPNSELSLHQVGRG